MKFSNIKKAELKHAGEIGQLFGAATRAMQARGIDQWDEYYPSEKEAVEDIQKNCLFCLWAEGRIGGAVSLNAEQDEQYKNIAWKDQSGKPLIVHRLAVHPDVQHQGIAKTLMLFAEDFGRENGYSSIRLDTYSRNDYSLAMYDKIGYEKKDGTLFFPRRKYHFYCFEKLIPAASMTM